MTRPLLSGFCNPGNDAASHARCRMSACACPHHLEPAIVEAVIPADGIDVATIPAGVVAEGTPSASVDWPATVTAWAGAFTEDDRAALVANRGPDLSQLAQAIAEGRLTLPPAPQRTDYENGRHDAFSDAIRWIMYGIPAKEEAP